MAAHGYIVLIFVARPRAAAQYTLGTVGRPARIVGTVAGVWGEPIVAPFQHIAAHVVEAKFVASFRADGTSAAARVGLVPSYFIEIVTSCKLVPLAFAAAASCVFPFCFGGQAVSIAAGAKGIVVGVSRCKAVLLAQPIAIRHCIEPTDVDDRAAAPAPAVVIWFGVPSMLAKQVEFVKGDFVLAEPVAADFDVEHGFFLCLVAAVGTLVVRAAHIENAALHPHHAGFGWFWQHVRCRW